MKFNTQIDILNETALITPSAGYTGLGGKSDGLYQKVGTVETKLATTTDLTSYLPLIGGTLTGQLKVTGQSINLQMFTPSDDVAGAILYGTNAAGTVANWLINKDGSFQGSKFIIKNGLSSTFLKADGSFDNSTYLTITNASTTYQPKLTGLSTNYLTKWNGTSLVNSLITDDGTNLSLGGKLYLNSPGGSAANFIMTGNGEQGIRMYNTNTTGNVNCSIKFANRNNADWKWIMYTDDSNSGADDFSLLNRNGYVIYADTNGNIGMGTQTLIGKLNVNGDIYASGNIISTGDVTAFQTSDKRLKKNINKLNNSLEIINKLNPVSYNWNKKAKELNSTKTDKKDVGVIAQELETILPNLVHNMYNDENIKGVDYIKIIPYLIGAIQELTTEINKLKNK